MKKWSGRRKKVTVVAVLTILVLAAVCMFVLLKSKDPASSPSKDEGVSREDVKDEAPSLPSPEETEEKSDDIPVEDIDPATLATIDIEPASLTISYIKGTGGFEYEVLRLSEGRRSIELRNADLIGTKCDQDTGVFVSIVQSPNESEQATIEKTTKVDGVEYGLSVASPTCTDEPELLKKYQDAFIKPFSLLKKLN